MLWDDRINNQGSASKLYGKDAIYRNVGYSYTDAENNKIVLGVDKNFAKNGENKATFNANPAVVGAEIMKGGWDVFISYFDKLGADYFINAARNNYNDNASGLMETIKNNVKGVGDAIRLSQMTHDWVNTAGWTEDRNKLEHWIGMFIMAEIVGPEDAAFIGEMNEYRGFWFNDRQSGNMWNALMGNGNTAFEWRDIENNIEGIRKWREYRGIKIESPHIDLPDPGTLEFEMVR